MGFEINAEHDKIAFMDILLVLQILVSVFLIAVILLQSRGTGLGSSMGGGGQSYHSRRGIEVLLFRATIGLTVVFIVLSLLPLFGLS